MGKGQELYLQAKKLIPGGTQLLSKRPEMCLPDLWPAYYSKAKGCKVWDLDGRKYTDMSYMGIGSCILGYADSRVNAAVKKAIDSANMTTLNAPEEVELARTLIRLHPWSEMARYARGGGDAMAVSVRIGRAYSRKDTVLFCGYHGWHDWYLSANLASNRALDGHLLPGLSPLGVPRSLKGTSYPFKYNDTEGFLKTAHKYGNKVGAIVLECIRSQDPSKEFIQAICRTARKLKAAFIVDEVTSGFRLNVGGAHLLYGIEPDIAVFGKGISNGFPMAAIIGKKNVMQVAQDTFISSTYWTDRIGPAAALATIAQFKELNVPQHLKRVGKKVQDGWNMCAKKNGVKIEVSGIYPLGHFSFVHPKPLVLKTIFNHKMLDQGFLATNAFYASYAHKDGDLRSYIQAADKAFAFIAKISKEKEPEKNLKGPVCHSGFQRLT
ncbi:MAG: aminotransferase class III-fold pyridoxal phosphate-dependent enzyme [Candidatus Omnitrophica bacterium]|nr:aminotransferase class III-fold pyridoxal phosphate-dependent enzyme [Candidatus Omnitrophota bacterium]